MKLSRVLLAVLVASPLLRADVLVVDAGGGGDFTTLTAAVAAAVDGDTLLVRDGVYVEAGQVVVDGKALTITAEWAGPGAFEPRVTIRPGLLVRNMAPGELVVLENLQLIGELGTATEPATGGLLLHHNSSHVRVQACTLIGGGGSHNYPDGAPGVEVFDTYSTALIGCTLNGGNGQFSPSPGVMTGDGGPGLFIDIGQVHLSYSVARGGSGGGDSIGAWPQGGAGGAGIAHLEGTLFVVGSSAHGADGGIAFFGGAGGDGIQMGGSGFAWLMADSSASHGSGGPSDSGPQGADGQSFDDPAGLVTNFGGSRRGFDVTSPLREGQRGSMIFDAEPSNATLLFASLSPHQLAFPAKQGVFMLNPSAMIGPIVLGFTGSGEVPFVTPALLASLQALNVHLQPAFVGAHGVVLGTGRVLTLLDAAY